MSNFGKLNVNALQEYFLQDVAWVWSYDCSLISRQKTAFSHWMTFTLGIPPHGIEAVTLDWKDSASDLRGALRQGLAKAGFRLKAVLRTSTRDEEKVQLLRSKIEDS